MKFSDVLIKLDACQSAIEWVGGKGLKKFWEECDRADWMLWLSAKMINKSGWSNHQEIVLIVCWCARRAQKHWTNKKDKRPMAAIMAAKKWANNPTEENRRAAAYAADAAADDDAAAAYAYASAADAAADARKSEHKIMCNHIRKNLKIGNI